MEFDDKVEVEPVGRISRNGRVYLPVSVRDFLELGEGDQMLVRVDKDKKALQLKKI